MDSERVCVPKKTAFVGIIIVFLLGYVIFTFLTLRSNQAKNSRASQNELPKQNFVRVNPSEALYKLLADQPYHYALKQPTLIGGNNELTLSFDSSQLETFSSVLNTSKTLDDDVYVVTKRSLTDVNDERFVMQFAGTELQEMLMLDGKVHVPNPSSTNLQGVEFILFKFR